MALIGELRNRTLSGFAKVGRGPKGFAEELIGQSADQFRYSLHKALLCSLRPWRGPPGEGRSVPSLPAYCTPPIQAGLRHETVVHNPSYEEAPQPGQYRRGVRPCRTQSGYPQRRSGARDSVLLKLNPHSQS